MAQKNHPSLEALRSHLNGRAIGLCVSALTGGGTERYCELIARGMREYGIRTVLLVEAERPVRAGLLPTLCDQIWYGALEPSTRQMNRYADIALFHLNVWQSESRWVSHFKDFEAPYVATLHTTIPAPLSESLPRFWRLGTIWNSATWRRRVSALRCPIIAISSLNKRRLEGLGPSVISALIWNGIPCAIDPPSLPDSAPRLIAWIGSLTPRKRPILALEVARQLGDNYHVAFAGSGSEEARLRAIVAEQQIPNVEFLGHVADSSELLRRSRLLLVTSRWEGLPYVAVEAMAMNRPIVATPCGALDEVILAESAGLVRPPNAKSLATAIREVIECQENGATDLKPRSAFDHLFRFDDFIERLACFYSEHLSRAIKERKS